MDSAQSLLFHHGIPLWFEKICNRSCG